MSNRFKVGDKVVRVRNSGNLQYLFVKIGEEATVHAVSGGLINVGEDSLKPKLVVSRDFELVGEEKSPGEEYFDACVAVETTKKAKIDADAAHAQAIHRRSEARSALGRAVDEKVAES